MRVLAITSELFPLIKTGGLADVCGALPRALAELGVECRTLLPGYAPVLEALEGRVDVWSDDALFGGTAKLAAGRAGELDLYVLDAPHLFAREGGIYVDEAGAEWPDNWARFGAFCRVGAMLALGRAAEYRPDVVHVHDWQAGLTPAYLSFWADGAGEPRPPSAITVHNLAFQGLAPAHLMGPLGLAPAGFSVEGYEFHGQIGFLKAGLYYADAITTVSPTYAREILTPAFGCGLDGLLRSRSRDLVGIVNGVDVADWDPRTDPNLPARYGPDDLSGKAVCKAEVRAALGLAPDAEGPLFGVVSRLTTQKGIDLLIEALPAILEGGGQLAIVGSGESGIEAAVAAAQAEHPGSVGAVFRYDEALSHRVQAGSDYVVVPSRYEPCGLTQLYGLRYGAPPIVARTGGLADTVIDANPAAIDAGVATGFCFDLGEKGGLARAVARAKAVWRDETARAAMARFAMRRDIGWTQSARRYKELYLRMLLHKNAAALGGADAELEESEPPASAVA